MARVNFREIRERFQHLDAKFVAFEHSFETRTASFSIEVYPYWEHPRFVEAVAAGKSWGFNNSGSEGVQLVTVHAKGLMALSATFLVDVEDWEFCERHPWLWRYEETGHITCNSPLGFEACLEVVEAACKTMGHPGWVIEALDYIDYTNVRKYGSRPPFFLGRLPRPLHIAMKEELQKRGVEIFCPYEPKQKELPILFHVDDDNYIIAEDFEVDVPDFEHKDEWFQG